MTSSHPEERKKEIAPAESLRLGHQWKDNVAEDREWQIMTPTDDVLRESVERLDRTP